MCKVTLAFISIEITNCIHFNVLYDINDPLNSLYDDIGAIETNSILLLNACTDFNLELRTVKCKYVEIGLQSKYGSWWNIGLPLYVIKS